jgi:hypothetical protein
LNFTWYSAVTETMVATRVMQTVSRKATATITIHSCRDPDFTRGFFCVNQFQTSSKKWIVFEARNEEIYRK